MTNFEQQELEIQKLNSRVEELEKKVDYLGKFFLQLGKELAVEDAVAEAAATTEPAAKTEEPVEKQKEKENTEIVEKPLAESLQNQQEIPFPAVNAKFKAGQRIAAMSGETQGVYFRNIISQCKSKCAADMAEKKQQETATDIAAVNVEAAEQTETSKQERAVVQEQLQINNFLQARQEFLQKYIKYGSNAEYDTCLDLKQECVKRLLNYPQWEAIPAELLKEAAFVVDDGNYTYYADGQQIDDVFYYFIAPRESADERLTSRDIIRSALPLVFNIEYTAGLQDKPFELMCPAVLQQCDDGAIKLHQKGELRLAR